MLHTLSSRQACQHAEATSQQASLACCLSASPHSFLHNLLIVAAALRIYVFSHLEWTRSCMYTAEDKSVCQTSVVTTHNVSSRFGMV